MPIPTPGFFSDLRSVASRIGCPALDLLQVMMAESGVSASALNPESGASGLIQIMPFNLAVVGWTGTADQFRLLSEQQQLPYCERYFDPYKSQGLNNLGRLYQAVFLPATLSFGSGDNTIICPRDDIPGMASILRSAYNANRTVDHGNKGYITVGDLKIAVAQTCIGPRWEEIFAAYLSAGGGTSIQPSGPLRIISQHWDANTHSICVEFEWDDIVGPIGGQGVAQYVDISTNQANFANWDCNNLANICFQANTFGTDATICNLAVGTTYYWRVNKLFRLFDGTQQWKPTGLATFTSIPSEVFDPYPASILGYPPVIEEAKVSVLATPDALEDGGLSVLPLLTAPHGPSSTPMANGPLESIVWSYTLLPGPASLRHGDALALVFAIIQAESSWNPNACGDARPVGFTQNCGGSIASPFDCSSVSTGFACSWGLFQLNVCCGQGFGRSKSDLINPSINASIGVPPIMAAIAAFGSTTQFDYSDTQIAQICQAAGHPGFVSNNPNTATADPLIRSVITIYNQIKAGVRSDNFPQV